MAKIESRGSVIFKEETNVTFSESAWVIVTHVPMGKMTVFGEKLEKWLLKQLHQAQPTLDRASPYSRMGTLINSRAKRSLQRLGASRLRLKETLSAVKTSRTKRGIFDGVGQGFKWLFGVATSSDLETINDRVNGLSKNQEDIVHIMSHQATVANETLWEVRQTAVVVSNLTSA